MIKSITTGAFAVMAMLAMAAPASANAAAAGMKMTPAEVSDVTHVHRGRVFRHYGYGHRRHWRPYRGIYFAAPYVAYRSYGYGYGYGDCHWLKRKAIRTGSSYWWRRYARCRGRW